LAGVVSLSGCRNAEVVNIRHWARSAAITRSSRRTKSRSMCRHVLHRRPLDCFNVVEKKYLNCHWFSWCRHQISMERERILGLAPIYKLYSIFNIHLQLLHKHEYVCHLIDTLYHSNTFLTLQFCRRRLTLMQMVANKPTKSIYLLGDLILLRLSLLSWGESQTPALAWPESSSHTVCCEQTKPIKTKVRRKVRVKRARVLGENKAQMKANGYEQINKVDVLGEPIFVRLSHLSWQKSTQISSFACPMILCNPRLFTKPFEQRRNFKNPSAFTAEHSILSRQHLYRQYIYLCKYININI
jgi:hypothetical protein